MAVLAARRLTEVHRQAQARLGAQTVLAMRRIWPLLDVDDIDGTVERWLNTATPIIQGQRAASSRLAGTYLTAFRALEVGVEAPAVPIAALPVDRKTVTTSLLVTGPYRLRAALGRGVQVSRALAIAESSSAAAAMRHALNGGRDAITQTVRSDPRAQGWQRVTSGNACDFCDMLAGRGAVYGEDSADFDCHDGCSCSAEPVYA